MPLHLGPARLASFSRRDFLRGLGGSIVFSALSRRALGHTPQVSPVFEEILPSASGIHWTHNAARSPHKYLPEATGPGCAFLDYDNDGWMDIYLVNSGKCDFYTPTTPLRNALYRNNRDGTFTDVTEKAGVSGGGFGMGVAVGDYNNDGFPDLYVTNTGGAFFIAITGTELSATSPGKQVSVCRVGHPALCGSTTTMTVAWICSSGSSRDSTKIRDAVSVQTANDTTAFPASFPPCRVGCSTTTETELLPM